MDTHSHGMHGVGVFKDHVDPDPVRCYKAFFRSYYKERRMAVTFSEDGLRWSAMVHLKGGKAEVDQQELVWSAPLEDASWPAKDIVRLVVRDGVSPVICLNGSHDRKPQGYDAGLAVRRDLA